MPSAAFLALFTAFMMLPTHIFLILKGRSTVESFQSSSQLKAEQSTLENEFQSKCLTAEMRRVRRQWEVEYGGVAVNDRWAFGRKRDMWKREMGPSWLGWLCESGSFSSRASLTVQYLSAARKATGYIFRRTRDLVPMESGFRCENGQRL